jgi:predicted DNA-binding protein
MRQTALRLPDEMLRDLKKIADADERSVAFIVRKFLAARIAIELPKLKKGK